MQDYRLDPPEYKYPECPICGGDAEEFYFDAFGEICGCDVCISIKNAIEYTEDLRYEN